MRSAIIASVVLLVSVSSIASERPVTLGRATCTVAEFHKTGPNGKREMKSFYKSTSGEYRVALKPKVVQISSRSPLMNVLKNPATGFQKLRLVAIKDMAYTKDEDGEIQLTGKGYAESHGPTLNRRTRFGTVKITRTKATLVTGVKFEFGGDDVSEFTDVASCQFTRPLDANLFERYVKSEFPRN